MKNIRGKFLVKKNILQDGKPCLIITGICIPKNFDIDSISDGDEMWVCDLMVLDGGLRFEGAMGGHGPSPEDFLSGEGQKESSWKIISSLNN